MSLFSCPVPVVKTCIRSLHSGSTMPSKMPTSHFLVRWFKILLTTCSNWFATSCLDSGESTIGRTLGYLILFIVLFSKIQSAVDYWRDDTEPTATVCLVLHFHQGPSHPKKARFPTTRRPGGIQAYELCGFLKLVLSFFQLFHQVLTNVERHQLHVIDSRVFVGTNNRDNISHLG